MTVANHAAFASKEKTVLILRDRRRRPRAGVHTARASALTYPIAVQVEILRFGGQRKQHRSEQQGSIFHLLHPLLQGFKRELRPSLRGYLFSPLPSPIRVPEGLKQSALGDIPRALLATDDDGHIQSIAQAPVREAMPDLIPHERLRPWQFPNRFPIPVSRRALCARIAG
jgi:hypothetical protein